VTLQVFNLPSELVSRNLAPMILGSPFGQNSVVHHDQKVICVKSPADGRCSAGFRRANDFLCDT